MWFVFYILIWIIYCKYFDRRGNWIIFFIKFNVDWFVCELKDEVFFVRLLFRYNFYEFCFIFGLVFFFYEVWWLDFFIRYVGISWKIGVYGVREVFLVFMMDVFVIIFRENGLRWMKYIFEIGDYNKCVVFKNWKCMLVINCLNKINM